MNENLLLSNSEKRVMIDMEPQQISPELAKQLAVHHLALAQLYRSIAGIKPIATESHQKRMRQANR